MTRVPGGRTSNDKWLVQGYQVGILTLNDTLVKNKVTFALDYCPLQLALGFGHVHYSSRKDLESGRDSSSLLSYVGWGMEQHSPACEVAQEEMSHSLNP